MMLKVYTATLLSGLMLLMSGCAEPSLSGPQPPEAGAEGVPEGDLRPSAQDSMPAARAVPAPAPQPAANGLANAAGENTEDTQDAEESVVRSLFRAMVRGAAEALVESGPPEAEAVPAQE